MAGRGPEEGRLRRLTARLALDGSVEFRGFVSEAEKARLYRAAWVHVLPSAKEGWGITAMEAAACGTPTVASSVPGLWESVRHGETGVLVPYGEVSALTMGLRPLLEDRGAMERMGTEARRWAERFSWERSAGDLEAFLAVKACVLRGIVAAARRVPGHAAPVPHRPSPFNPADSGRASLPAPPAGSGSGEAGSLP